MTALFYLLTLAAGFFLQIVFGHYFSVMGVGPNFLLLLVLAMGFGLGPLVGESMGFIWGLMADLTGLHLFGLNAFILTIFGYAAGKLRRRIDGERATPQIVMACLSTVFSMVIMSSLYNLFEETSDPVGFVTLLISVLLNGLLSAGVFWSVEKWIQIWEIDRDHQ